MGSPNGNDQEVKMDSSNWECMKIQHERKIARLQLELMKNTADFNDNTDAMYGFYKLIGCSMYYPTYTRLRCFGGYAKLMEEVFFLASD